MNEANHKKDKKAAKSKKQDAPPKIEVTASRVHLYNNIKTSLEAIQSLPPKSSESIYKVYPFEHIHYSFINLGLKVRAGKITSHTEICNKILTNFRDILEDMHEKDQVFVRYVETKLTTCKNILAEFIHLDESMQNVFNFLFQVNSIISLNADMDKACRWLIDRIDDYVMQKFKNAETLIIENSIKLIKTDDHILTTTHSNIIVRLVEEAVRAGINFTVYIVYDPQSEKSKQDCLRLQRTGANIVMTNYSNMAYFMNIVNKVFVSGNVMYQNGYLLANSGVSTIALFAKKFRKPLYVLVSSFKFSDKTLIDSLVVNESNYDVNDPDRVIRLEYDLVPSRLISLLITEIGLMPPTSVPVILREFKFDFESLNYEE